MLDTFTSGIKSHLIAPLLSGSTHTHTHIRLWTLKMKCTRYVICGYISGLQKRKGNGFFRCRAEVFGRVQKNLDFFSGGGCPLPVSTSPEKLAGGGFTPAIGYVPSHCEAQSWCPQTKRLIISRLCGPSTSPLLSYPILSHDCSLLHRPFFTYSPIKTHAMPYMHGMQWTFKEHILTPPSYPSHILRHHYIYPPFSRT